MSNTSAILLFVYCELIVAFLFIKLKNVELDTHRENQKNSANRYAFVIPHNHYGGN